MRKEDVFYSVWKHNSCISRSNFEVSGRGFILYFRSVFLFLNVILITAKSVHFETHRDVIRLSSFPASSQFIVVVMISCQNSLSLHSQSEGFDWIKITKNEYSFHQDRNYGRALTFRAQW
jgi:hypothetical protein